RRGAVTARAHGGAALDAGHPEAGWLAGGHPGAARDRPARARRRRAGGRLGACAILERTTHASAPARRARLRARRPPASVGSSRRRAGQAPGAPAPARLDDALATPTGTVSAQSYEKGSPRWKPSPTSW